MTRVLKKTIDSHPYKGLIGWVALLFLICLGQANAEWPTPWSGSLPRPVLFVHGINADHQTWQVDTAAKVCNPTGISLTNWYSYQNAVTPSKPLGHLLEFNVACDDGSSQKVVKKYNNTASGNRLGDRLPATMAINVGTPSNPNFQVKAVEWYLWSANNTTLTFYRLVSRPSNIDATVIRTVKTSDISGVIKQAWMKRPYAGLSGTFKNGLVSAYKEEYMSPPALMARYYGMPPDATRFNYPSNSGGSMINHNGIEFYCSVNSAGTASDPFTRPDWTGGAVWNAALGKYEIGQTDQLYARVAATLDEYFTDWATNASRQIDLVCHSQGCLVARNLFQAYKTSTTSSNPVNHIRSIVMLTSPQLGTAIATDNSGIPSANQFRNDIYSLYNRGCLNEIPFTVDLNNFLGWVSFGLINTNFSQITFKVDVLKDLRNIAKNFTSTDQYLSYAQGIQQPGWLPQGSVMKTGSAGGVGWSTFTTALHNGGYPTWPSNGAKIPITAYYGTAPGVGMKLMNAFRLNGKAACDADVIPLGQAALSTGERVDVKVSADDVSYYLKNGVSSFLQNYQCPEITQFISNKTCTELVEATYQYLSPKFQQLDNDWTPFSDFIVDVGSQSLLGSFSSATSPFVLKPLNKKFAGDPGTPHLTIPMVGEGGRDLLGATAHGVEILYALEGYNGKTQSQVDAILNPSVIQPIPFSRPPRDSLTLVPAGSGLDGGPMGAFYMGKTEVTTSSYIFKTFFFGEALSECNRRSIAEKLSPVYELSNPVVVGSRTTTYQVIKYFPRRNGYRLPTEREWSYAYLAGNNPSALYYWGNNTTPSIVDLYANYFNSPNISSRTWPGTRQPNAWNLFDMAGLLEEWVFSEGSNIQCTMGGSMESRVENIAYDKKTCVDVRTDNRYNPKVGLRVVRNVKTIAPILELLD